jgi:hypothetical protein
MWSALGKCGIDLLIISNHIQELSTKHWELLVKLSGKEFPVDLPKDERQLVL